ncbi:ATP-binding protein, partial [Actinomadura geliboluensis]
MTGTKSGDGVGDRAPSATVWLLVGLTGSGKTTFAKRLEERGVVRLSVDEEVFRRHGRYGVDFHESRWFELADPVAEEVYQRLGDLVKAGRDVVLDVGLERPGLGGGPETWKGEGLWHPRESTPLSCVNARSVWSLSCAS